MLILKERWCTGRRVDWTEEGAQPRQDPFVIGRRLRLSTSCRRLGRANSGLRASPGGSAPPVNVRCDPAQPPRAAFACSTFRVFPCFRLQATPKGSVCRSPPDQTHKRAGLGRLKHFHFSSAFFPPQCSLCRSTVQLSTLIRDGDGRQQLVHPRVAPAHQHSQLRRQSRRRSNPPELSALSEIS